MSEKITGLIVAFEKPVHEDDVQLFIAAISMMRGVENVQAISNDSTLATKGNWLAKQQVRAELREKFLAIWQELGK